MTLNLARIAAALNAYPWTRGRLTSRAGQAAPQYCAVGLLLRYAGVPQQEVAGVRDFWARYGGLLQAEYGIPDARTAFLIVAANDSAASHAEAIERVLGVATGALDLRAVWRLAGRAAPGAEWQPGRPGGHEQGPDDGAGCLALTP
jgi:hypothetical protein